MRYRPRRADEIIVEALLEGIVLIGLLLTPPVILFWIGMVCQSFRKACGFSRVTVCTGTAALKH